MMVLGVDNENSRMAVTHRISRVILAPSQTLSAGAREENRDRDRFHLSADACSSGI
jgi:hypothetical protein